MIDNQLQCDISVYQIKFILSRSDIAEPKMRIWILALIGQSGGILGGNAMKLILVDFIKLLLWYSLDSLVRFKKIYILFLWLTYLVWSGSAVRNSKLHFFFVFLPFPGSLWADVFEEIYYKTVILAVIYSMLLLANVLETGSVVSMRFMLNQPELSTVLQEGQICKPHSKGRWKPFK